jgi:hypothetical protein
VMGQRRIVRWAACTTVLLAMAVSFGGCSRNAPAAPRDLKLLATALNEPAKYSAAMAQLAARPDAARAALREQSAPEGTRREFLLRLIGDHVEHAGDYERWAGATPESLDGSEQEYFWAERLLFGDAAQGVVAAKKLGAKCCGEAGEALSWRIRDTSRDADPGFLDASAAIGKAGEVGGLLAALETWFGVDASVRANTGALDALRAAANLLPGERRAAIEKDLLASLEKDTLSRAARQARIALLWVVVEPASLERIAALRKTEWGTDLRRDIDPVLAKAFMASTRMGSGLGAGK